MYVTNVLVIAYATQHSKTIPLKLTSIDNHKASSLTMATTKKQNLFSLCSTELSITIVRAHFGRSF